MKRYFILLLILLLFSGIAIAGVYFPTNSCSQSEIIFTVAKGEGSREIALNLQEKGLIFWGPIFRAYVYIKGIQGNLQAGTYELNTSMNIPEIADKFAKGEVIEIKVTIPEGFTVKQIEEKLNLKLPGENLEGFLFPDTYKFRAGITGAEVVEIMQDNFDKKLTPDLREEIERQNKTILEIITMASLLEKEVITLEDKKMVSGIFWKRIKAGMPLNSCATIAYILRVDKWRYSFEDTRTESLYNTYLNLGLPPGPICNSGIESIKAAAYPKESSFWYFLSTPEGKTIFSKTLAEHNAAKVKYLK